ncbi:DMT family transporter [Pelagibacterium lentulum]|nr:DMT family transporter [Pelagibacterium lentulum]
MPASSASPAIRTHAPESGIALMVLAMLLVPIGDTLSKLLTDIMGPLEIGFWRFLLQGGILTVAVLVMRKKLTGAPIWLLIVGGVSSATTLAALIGAFAVMPIATAIAIFFVEPLILTVLAGLILREPTGWRRYIAVAVGLIGAIIVIRPSWSIFGWASLLPLLAAFAFAINAITMRQLSKHLDSLAIQFWFAIIAAIFLGVMQLSLGDLDLFSFTNGLDLSGPWFMLFCMGLLSGLTFFLITEAFRRTPATTLAPFQYLEIVGATALGYIVFGDFPDFWTWVGTAIILASGLYVFDRERRAKKHGLA